MTSPNLYSKSDPEMQQALTALQGHVEAMSRAANRVLSIVQEIATSYVAGSSMVFQNKMTDWIEQYNKVMQAFQTLGDDTAAVNQVINNAEEDAHTTALTLNVSAALTA